MKYGAPALAPFQAVAHGIRIEKKSEQNGNKLTFFSNITMNAINYLDLNFD